MPLTHFRKSKAIGTENRSRIPWRWGEDWLQRTQETLRMMGKFYYLDCGGYRIACICPNSRLYKIPCLGSGLPESPRVPAHPASLPSCFVSRFKMTRGWGYVCDCLPSDVIFAFTPSSTLQALFGHGKNCCFGCHFWSVLCLVFLAGITQSKVPGARLVAFGYCMLCGGHLLLRPPLALGCLVPHQHWWLLGSLSCRPGTVLPSRLLFVFQPDYLNT